MLSLYLLRELDLAHALCYSIHSEYPLWILTVDIIKKKLPEERTNIFLPTQDPRTLIPLTPAAFHILLVLGNADLYGLVIMQDIEILTHGQMRLGPGTLYRSLHQMVHDGLIEERGDVTPIVPRDERRRVYHLTSLGRKVARLEAQRLALLVEAARERGFFSHEEEKP